MEPFKIVEGAIAWFIFGSLFLTVDVAMPGKYHGERLLESFFVSGQATSQYLGPGTPWWWVSLGSLMRPCTWLGYSVIGRASTMLWHGWDPSPMLPWSFWLVGGAVTSKNCLDGITLLSSEWMEAIACCCLCCGFSWIMYPFTVIDILILPCYPSAPVCTSLTGSIPIQAHYHYCTHHGPYRRYASDPGIHPRALSPCIYREAASSTLLICWFH